LSWSAKREPNVSNAPITSMTPAMIRIAGVEPVCGFTGMTPTRKVKVGERMSGTVAPRVGKTASPCAVRGFQVYHGSPSPWSNHVEFSASPDCRRGVMSASCGARPPLGILTAGSGYVRHQAHQFDLLHNSALTSSNMLVWPMHNVPGGATAVFVDRLRASAIRRGMGIESIFSRRGDSDIWRLCPWWPRHLFRLHH
jgi:hypothetical protein